MEEIAEDSVADIAPVRLVDGELIINPNNRAFWDNPALLAKYQHQAGFWSTDDPSHVIFHETGHDAWVEKAHKIMAATSLGTHFPHMFNREFVQETHDHRISRRKFEDEISPTLAALFLDEVGRHALVSMAEFIAEVYAGLLVGKIYSPEVMQQYKGFGGPRCLSGAYKELPGGQKQ